MATRAARRPMFRAVRGVTPGADFAKLGDAAWLAIVPAAVVVFVAMMVLGPVVGRLLDGSAPHDYWPFLAASGNLRPEPTEQGRYVVALAAPLLVSVALLLTAPEAPRRQRRTVTLLVGSVQLLLAACALGIVVVIQHLPNRFGGAWAPRAYFTWATIGSAVAIACAIAFVIASGWRERAYALLRETRGRRIAACAIAACAIVPWLLTAVNTDASIGGAVETFVEIQNTIDAPFAVLSGQGPLVGIHALFGQLPPYLAAASMALFGSTLGVYTVTMVSMTGGVMLPVYACLRRLARSSIGGLALFLPFLATSFFMIRGTLVDRLDAANLFLVFPERYAGPFVMAWLVSRHLDRARPRSEAVLFAAAGFALVSDFEFGVPAFGATVAAVVWTRRSLWPRDIARLLGNVAIGLAGSAAVVTMVALVVEGALPHFAWLPAFSRIYGAGGVVMWPMPALGIHLVMYLSFSAAIVIASFRAVRREEDRLLTGMLAWSGVFGLGALAYYVGQSHPQNLIFVFSAWVFAVVVLVVAVLRALAARPSHRPTAPELVVLFCFGLAVCSLAQVPAPWSQVDRILHRTTAPRLTRNSLEHFVAADTSRGEHVLMLTRLPHRISYDVGVIDVAQFSAGIEVMPLESELRESLQRLRRAGGHKVFAWAATIWPEQLRMLRRAGFAVTRRLTDDTIEGVGGSYLELRDDRRGDAR